MEGDIQHLFDQGLDLAKKEGLRHLFLSAFLKSSRGLSVYEGEMDSLEISDEVKIGVWVCDAGRWGCASFEKVQESSLKNAIEAARAAALCNEPDPDMTLGEGSSGQSDFSDATTTELSMEFLKRLALSLEENARHFSPSVTHVPVAAVGHESLTRILRSSEGVCVVEKNSLFHAGLSVMAAGKDGRTVNAHESAYSVLFKDYQESAFIEEVAGEAVSRIEPRFVASGEYPILFDSRTSAQILGTFWPIFSGDLLYRGLTRLKGKQGTQIAGPQVMMEDSSDRGLVSHAFDAEGTTCDSKKIIDGGVFQTFLHNRYTAKKAGGISTGHAAGGLEALPGVSPSNISWGGGACVSREDLMGGISRGLLIKELHGASASPVSGDFSYGALGYWVGNGKVQYPVADFTIAGNIFDLLMRIEVVGDDLKWVSPHPLGSYGGRSLLVSHLTVTGK